MRLWSIHPEHLDSKGLVALWREGLLAKHVLEGKTKGYRNHPQLERFKNAKHPKSAINAYLAEVVKEATKRGYSFDKTKINSRAKALRLPVTDAQIEFEKKHLLKKLAVRDRERHKLFKKQSARVHPSFRVVAGDIEPWEKA